MVGVFPNNNRRIKRITFLGLILMAKRTIYLKCLLNILKIVLNVFKILITKIKQKKMLKRIKNSKR